MPGTGAAQLAGVELMAHLFRRAGFGATRDELEVALDRGYEATVDDLVHPERSAETDMDVFYRTFPDCLAPAHHRHAQISWLYRMINTRRPLEEKMTLFWHGLFATGEAKVLHPPALVAQIDTFRRNALRDLRTILLDLSRDPAMIYWLDNQENTRTVHNENYGRELLELFSMGVGNYTEDDVKSCARAFTGWGLRTTRTQSPYGRADWGYEFRADQHDYGDKVFLGEEGPFDGGDVIDVVVRQPATARFIAGKLYGFFVSDEPDPEAIDRIADVFAGSGGDIRETVRGLLLSPAFRSLAAYYAKVKSPTELIVGIARLVGEFRQPATGLAEFARAGVYMGQDLLNPPSVEGWHTGIEWIDSGLLIERVNFATEHVRDMQQSGMRRLLERLHAMGELDAAALVDACLDLVGPLPVRAATRDALVSFAARSATDGPVGMERRVGNLLSLIVASREFQCG